MRDSAGRIRRQLAAKLQRDIPEIAGRPITWDPYRMWRTNGRPPKGMDWYRWSAVPVWAGGNNDVGIIFNCWETMRACIKPGRLSVYKNPVSLTYEIELARSAALVV